MTQKTCSPQLAAALMQQGAVIAYATEAVWGLGCDPFNAAAVQRLLNIKQRAVEKGMILAAADWQQLRPFIDEIVLSKVQQQAIEARPTTWVLPFKAGTLPAWVVGTHETVAIRISQHATVKALSQAFNGPIISTSANPAGCQPAREIFQVRRYFGVELPVCRGRIGHQQRPSQIVDGLTGQILRN